MSTRYLFVSTSSAAGLTEKADAALRSLFGRNVSSLNIGDSGQYWTNGYVLRLESSESVHVWRDYLRAELSDIATFWLLHDGRGNAIDNRLDVGMTVLKKLGSNSICQLFVRYDKSSERCEAHILRLRSALETGKVSCRHAFPFSNGDIYFLTSTQPSNPIFRRCENILRPPIEFTFIAPNEVCYRPGIGELNDDVAWTTLEPPRDLFRHFAA